MKKKANKTVGVSQTQALTEEEIKQIRRHLKAADEQEKKTISSSKESFIGWLNLINVACSIIDKIWNCGWEQIQSNIINPILNLINK
jgi:hypothetical protein